MGTPSISAGFPGLPRQVEVDTGKVDVPPSNEQAQKSAGGSGSAASTNTNTGNYPYPQAEASILCQIPQVRRYETSEGGGAHVFMKPGYIGNTPPDPNEQTRLDAASPGCESLNGTVVPPQSNPTPVKREAGNESAADDDPWQQQAAPRQEAQQKPLSEEECKLPVGQISGQKYFECKRDETRAGGPGVTPAWGAKVTAISVENPITGEERGLSKSVGAECPKGQVPVKVYVSPPIVKTPTPPFVTVAEVSVQAACMDPKQAFKRGAVEVVDEMTRNGGFGQAKTGIQNRWEAANNAGNEQTSNTNEPPISEAPCVKGENKENPACIKF